MFVGATAFNQDLCHFGDNWPISSVGAMFSNSGCLYKTVPLEGALKFKKSVYNKGEKARRILENRCINERERVEVVNSR